MDLFDIVRAAPPPENVREPTKTAPTASELEAVTEMDADADADANTEQQKTGSGTPVPLVTYDSSGGESDTDTQTCSLKKTDAETDEIVEPAEQLEGKDVDNDVVKDVSADKDVNDDKDANDNEDDEDDDGQPQPVPPKTKAQQKMFADVPLPLKEKGCHQIQQCVVRIRRLQQPEIDRWLTGKATKRGRPRKNPDIDPDDFVSPSPSPKKSKISPSKIHIKLSQNGGAKQRDSLKFPRAPTPPPLSSPLRSIKTTSTPTKSPGRSPTKVSKRLPLKCGASAALIKRYGRRVFSCVVNVKRLKHSSIGVLKSPKRKSKSKLSVSFSEAVEILGSKPRKSSSIGGGGNSKLARSSLCASVPTRLQRVDATGNVVEDIELSPSGSLSGSALKTKRSRSDGRNGTRRGRKPRPSSSLRVPVSGLASLSIEDSQADNETGDEYIVPNDLPEHQARGVRRSGTPSPVKRVTTTTTVSDSEDAHESEEDERKKTTKEPENKSEPQTNETMSKTLEDSEEQELEKLHWEPDVEPTSQDDTKHEQEDAKSKEEKAAETTDAKLKAEEEEKLRKTQDEEEEAKRRAELEAKLESELDAKLDPELESGLSSELEAKLDAELDTETDLDFRKSPPIYPVISDDVTSDDILEIQTSIEDVRELQTPPSPIEKRSLRFESPESDASFKSATELANSTATENTDKREKQASNPKTTDATEATDSGVMTKQNASQQSTSNGSEPASSSSITQPTFSPIDDIPNLDDDELGQLVELSNSRHAISGSTLDDIMTVLES